MNKHQLNWRSARLLAVTLAFGLMAVGCGTTNKAAAKRIAAFSKATDLAADNTVNAFDTVERRHFELAVARAAAGDGWKTFDRQALQPFLPPEQLQIRKEVLGGLQAYAETLSSLMGNEQLDAFDKATQELAESLTSLDEEVVKANLTAGRSLSEAQVQAGATAINALGRWLIDGKRRKAVAASAKEMHPNVTNIVLLLQADIKVLRRNVGKAYDEELQAKRVFLANNESKMDPLAKRAEVRGIVDTVIEMQKTDESFAAMQNSLAKLALAHAALPTAFERKGPIPLDELIADAIEEGKRIKKFYETLETQKD